MGAPGNESNFFGLCTQKAVEKFQKKYGIVANGRPDSTGFGMVGPRTLQKLREFLGL
jgi:hypothetical protein